jgi:hypothetical protein
MERIKYDINRFLRTPDGVANFTAHETVEGKTDIKDTKSSINLTVLLVIITLIGIIIAVFFYTRNKRKNVTKETINSIKKESNDKD